MYQIPKIPSIEETRCSLCDRSCIKYSCFDRPHQLTEHRQTSLIKRKKEKVSKRERERETMREHERTIKKIHVDLKVTTYIRVQASLLTLAHTAESEIFAIA